MKKTIIKRLENKSVCYRNAEIVTTTVSQCSMSSVSSSRGLGHRFSLFVDCRLKGNTKREKHAHIFVECVSIYTYTLSSSSWVACSDGTSHTGATSSAGLSMSEKPRPPS